MPKNDSSGSGWRSFILGLGIMGVIALGALMPLTHVQKVLDADRASVRSLLNEDEAEEAVFDSAKFEDNGDPLRDVYLQDGPKINKWASERMEVVTLWGQIISYRMTLLHIWLLAMLPLLLASFVDGYFVREGRKYAFKQQSSVRHKAGVMVAISFSIVAALSILLPVPVSPLLMPFALASVGLAAWIWVSNLQKRI